MLGILDLRKKVSIALLLVAVATLVSCAHDRDTQLVSDPNRKYESTIPWNKQEDWEQEGSGQVSQLMHTR
jgi:hypothetical protein